MRQPLSIRGVLFQKNLAQNALGSVALAPADRPKNINPTKPETNVSSTENSKKAITIDN